MKKLNRSQKSQKPSFISMPVLTGVRIFYDTINCNNIHETKLHET